jgi:hypothetical protein
MALLHNVVMMATATHVGFSRVTEKAHIILHIFLTGIYVIETLAMLRSDLH